MKPILYLDMDGFLFDYDSHYKLHNLRKDQPEPQGFFETIPIYPGAVDFVNALYDSGKFEIYFLSTPSWSSPTSYTEKRLALEAHFRKEIVYKKLILSHNKGLLKGDYIIDDRKVNGVENFEGIHLHYGQPEDNPLDYNKILKYFNIHRSNVIIVGVTGIIGSGKTTFVKEMENLGYITYSSDKVVKHLLAEKEELIKNLVNRYSDKIVVEGFIDSHELAKIAFKTSRDAKDLNAFIHPYLREHFTNYINLLQEQNKEDVVLIWEAPLLFETGLNDIFHYTVGVAMPLEEARKRAIMRGMSSDDYDKRMQFQLTNKHTKCNYTVLNTFSVENLKQHALNLDKILKKKFFK